MHSSHILRSYPRDLIKCWIMCCIFTVVYCYVW